MATRTPTNTLDRPLGGSRGARYEQEKTIHKKEGVEQ